MSQEITEAHVKQFNSNVYMLSQQRGSRLRKAVRQETQQSKAQSFDRVGTVTASKIQSRHGDTPLTDTPHSRRWVTMSDYDHADIIDKQDRIRIIIDPESSYSRAFQYAMGRAMDDEIIEAHDADAVTGEEQGGTASLPNTQKIVSVDSSGGGDNLNIQALRKAKSILDANEVDEDIPRYIAVNSSAIYSLLGEEKMTSSDYNTVKALVDGKIDTFMGFKFIRLERFKNQSGTLNFDDSSGSSGDVGSGSGDADGYKKLFCWAEDGIISSVGMDIIGRVSERSDKRYATQVYAAMSSGAVRMEEEKVVSILCNQS